MKNWRLTIGTNHYYLTDQEKDFYLGSVRKGDQYAVFSDKILSTKFMDLVQSDILDQTKRLDSGEYQCEAGNWHAKGVDCSCGIKLEFDEKRQVFIRKN